jgi:V/A-type H+-transporting ATPase subunit K
MIIGEATGAQSAVEFLATQYGLIALSASLAIGLAALATGIAQKAIGPAAIGAMMEDKSFFGKGLVLIALPETIIIFGFVIALSIIGLAKFEPASQADQGDNAKTEQHSSK